MQKGRKPMPLEQKKLLGNPGRRPIPSDDSLQVMRGVREAPEPLRPLESAGLAMWERVWDSAQGWVSPETDVDLLQLTCELQDERAELREVVRGTGEWRDRRALRMIDAQIVSNLSLLGFTPADRSRLGVAVVKAESKLEEMRRKRDER